MTKPHVLFIAFGYPPCRGSGVYRAVGIAEGLREAGFDVTVLTVEVGFWDKFTGADYSLMSRIHEDIEVVRVPFEFEHQVADLKKWSKSRLVNPKKWHQAWAARGNEIFPEPGYANLVAPFDRAARQIQARKPVDLVIATANPHVSFKTAYDLWESFGIPYVMDYRDAWTLNVFTGEDAELPDTALHLEGKYLGDCAQAWFVNEPLLQWHANRYPGSETRMRVVPNAWDTPRVDVSLLDRADDRNIRFGYVGTVTGRLPISEFLQGWELFLAGKDADGSVAGFYGSLGFVRGGAQRSDGPDSVRFHGRIDKADLVEVYSNLDVLLFLAGGAEGGSRFVTSGKVFEYMSTGLPIVGVCPPDSQALAYLKDYPLFFDGNGLSPDGIARALGQAFDFALNPNQGAEQAAKDFADTFRRDRVLRDPVEGLMGLAT